MDVTNKAERTGNQAHQALDQAASRVAEKAGPAIDRVAAAAHQTVDKVVGAAGPAAQWVNQSADQLRRQQEELAETARSYVRERPLVALGAALAAGYLIGKLSR